MKSIVYPVFSNRHVISHVYFLVFPFQVFKSTGFYHSGPELYCNQLRRDPRFVLANILYSVHSTQLFPPFCSFLCTSLQLPFHPSTLPSFVLSYFSLVLNSVLFLSLHSLSFSLSLFSLTLIFFPSFFFFLLFHFSFFFFPLSPYDLYSTISSISFYLCSFQLEGHGWYWLR